MNIGENIKRIRKAKGLTQTELGEKIGKSLRQVQKYESGEVSPSISNTGLSRGYIQMLETGRKLNPSLSTIEAIAQVLEVTVPELIGYPPQQIIYKDTPISDFSTEELFSELERRVNK